MRVTQNWLVGLTRQPAVVQRFPFLKSLANNWQLYSNPAECSACGQKSKQREFSNQVNEIAKILATIPEDEIQEFKRMVKSDSLIINYIDIRGNRQQTIR